MVNIGRNKDGYVNSVELVKGDESGIVFWTACDLIGVGQTERGKLSDEKRGIIVSTFDGLDVVEAEQFAIGLMQVCESFRNKASLEGLLTSFVHD